MYLRATTFLLLCICFYGCAGSQIAKEEYSALSTPQETFEFAKEAVIHDDPEAFYYCLADYIQQQVPLSDLRLAWALAGKYFSLLLKVELQNIEQPAPDLPHRPDMAKVSVAVDNLEAAFLLMNEKGKWKLANPNHYSLPDVSQLPQQERLPWRTGKYAYHRIEPDDWFAPPKIQRVTVTGKSQKQILWRNDKPGFYKSDAGEWFAPKKVVPREPWPFLFPEQETE